VPSAVSERSFILNCQKFVKKYFKIVKKIVKKLSKSSQKVVKKLPKMVKKLSKPCSKVVKKLSKLSKNSIKTKTGQAGGGEIVNSRPSASALLTGRREK
jgi:hypothetical protein